MVSYLSDPSVTLAYRTSTIDGSSFIYSIPLTSTGSGFASVYISAETKQHDRWAQTSALTLLTIPAVSSDALWPDHILTPLQEGVRTCHFLFVQQGQRADGQVEFSRVLEYTLIHACVLHNTHTKRQHTDLETDDRASRLQLVHK